MPSSAKTNSRTSKTKSKAPAKPVRKKTEPAKKKTAKPVARPTHKPVPTVKKVLKSKSGPMETAPTQKRSSDVMKNEALKKTKPEKKITKAAPAPEIIAKLPEPEVIKPIKVKAPKPPEDKIERKLRVKEEPAQRGGRRKKGGNGSAFEDALADNVLDPVVHEEEPTFEPKDEYLDALEPEDLTLEPDDIIAPDDLALVDLEIPIDFLDPDLIDIAAPIKPAAPKPPKPKPPKADRRQVPCSGCGQTVGWLSVEGLCFNCLKKKIAAKRRDDETYSGSYSAADADDDDD
jgi:hypothetical protein